jgi:hypothetical protein
VIYDLTNTEVWGITIGVVVFILSLGLLSLIRLIGRNSQIRFGFFIEHGQADYTDEDTWPKGPTST